MKFKEHSFILFLILALLGAMATIQIRSTVRVQRESAQAVDMNRLNNQLNADIQAGKDYKVRIEDIEKRIEVFLQAADISGANAAMKRELEYLRFISGQTDVAGDGIIITLNDADVFDREKVMDYIIHDLDILNVINELRQAGAQAIAINDERIIATSEQLCAGPTIKINNNRYAVPYEIKAIGDAGALYTAMKESSVIHELIEYKKRVTIKQQENIIIPKFSNDINSLISKLEVVNDENKKNK